MAPLRWQCQDCDWIGGDDELDIVADPKPGSRRAWTVCPACRAAEHFTNLCDEPGCNREATCGWPSPAGYRRTCGQHWVKDASQ